MEGLGYLYATGSIIQINRTMLNAGEQKRYNRQLIIPEIGEEGQQRLKASRILIVGAGGLGSAASVYLAATGIGTLGIMDADTIDLSNLQRQILYKHSDTGQLKSSVAGTRLREQNPWITIHTYPEKLTQANCAIIREYDVVVSCLDNSATRYLLDENCSNYNIPLVHASVSKFEAQVSVFNYNNGPSYHDIFPVPPTSDFETPEARGVIAPLPGIAGCMQATEVIKIITKAGQPLSGKLLIINTLIPSFRIISLTADKN